MKLKKILILILAMFLTGCSSNESDLEEVFSVSSGQREIYEQAIAKAMDSFYWKYDVNSILYSEQNIPSRTDESAKESFDASLDGGYDLIKYSGRPTVVATVKLIHFNSDDAGLAYIYFNKNEIIGAYYTSPETPGRQYSLKSRNVFTRKTDFAAFESELPLKEFQEKKSSFPIDGFCSVGKNDKGEILLAVLNEKSVSVYRYKNDFSLLRTITFDGESVPISASFFRDGENKADSLAILTGTIVYSEFSHDSEGYYMSDKIVFLTPDMQKSGEEYLLGETDYTCVASDGGQLMLANDTVLEYLKKEAGIWTKMDSFTLKHGVKQIQEEDLDGDGKLEYLMTDGMDFYVYSKGERGFLDLWKTHLSIESITGNIYCGDLNQDGVKEIYVCDITGTAIRYILTDIGLVSRNEDINYGQRFYVYDFNQDGKDDYIKINDAENNSQKLYIAK